MKSREDRMLGMIIGGIVVMVIHLFLFIFGLGLNFGWCTLTTIAGIIIGGLI